MRMRFKSCCLLLAVSIIGLGLQSARAEDKMVVASRSTSKFVNLPGLPTCATASVQNGDPSKAASVILAKAATGCTIPWHWHTANEQLMIVAGSAKVSMKEGAPASVHSGDYLSLPGKNAHQFSCVAACTFFVVPDGAFDIHYVNTEGKEISPDVALKSKTKPAGKKAPAKNEMKDMKM
jgi:quercetin dioxygenase-like cupin family protein